MRDKPKGGMTLKSKQNTKEKRHGDAKEDKKMVKEMVKKSSLK
jgi:hypothetical protein